VEWPASHKQQLSATHRRQLHCSAIPVAVCIFDQKAQKPLLGSSLSPWSLAEAHDSLKQLRQNATNLQRNQTIQQRNCSLDVHETSSHAALHCMAAFHFVLPVQQCLCPLGACHTAAAFQAGTWCRMGCHTLLPCLWSCTSCTGGLRSAGRDWLHGDHL